MPEGKRSPPPATPSFRVEKIYKIKKPYFPNCVISSPLHLWRGVRGEAEVDVALARTEGVGRRDSDPDSLGSHRRKAPHGSPARLGSAESPAEARRWGALQGTPTERPEFDFVFAFAFAFAFEFDF